MGLIRANGTVRGMNALEYKELERVLKALGNRRRLAILAFLKKKGEASVSAIASELKLSLKATSKHLALLAAAGILDKEQRSTNVFFWISKSAPSSSRHTYNLLP